VLPEVAESLDALRVNLECYQLLLILGEQAAAAGRGEDALAAS
jgi:hypothetical protein